MTSCFRNAIWMARDLHSLFFPGQFTDMCRGRDFAAALVDVEAEVDVWEPSSAAVTTTTESK